jgi:pyruvate dehydrogenase E2 component (dihydrolipoamide acetyltransferase)
VHVSKKYDFFGYVDRIPLKGVRKVTAEHMTKSAYTAPHVTHMDEVDVTELAELREREKATAEKKQIHLTYLPFIVKALIAALKEHPLLNASLDDEHGEIIIKKYYNIGIAVDTPDGLIVPVVKNAQDKSIMEIAKEIEDLAQRAQTRKLDLMDMRGSSFTITNIGVIGGLHATPIINWPDVAILATGKIYDKVVYKDEKITVRKHLPFSIAFDHRVVDGAEVARFANALRQRLEDPGMLMMEE